MIIEILKKQFHKSSRMDGEKEDLSQERVLKTLMDFGLTRMDARVYILLGRRGQQKGITIAKTLKTHKQQVYRSLKNLENKGLVSFSLEHPARYSAEPFQKVIDLHIRTKIEEAQQLRHKKDSIIEDWLSLSIDADATVSERFIVIKGRNVIYSRIKQMIQQTKKCLSTMTSIPSLARADDFGLFEDAFNHSKGHIVEFRFLTELSRENVVTIEKILEETTKEKVQFKIRVPDLGLQLLNRIVIRDDEEALFFISPTNSTTQENDELCLWTNCKSLVQSFMTVFEDLWKNSAEIDQKILEIKTGKSPPKTCVIKNAEESYRKYQQILNFAKEKVIILTSSNGLTWCSREKIIQECALRGILVKIMGPVTNNNMKAVRLLSKHCQVKHVPTGYLGTIIVDDRHLFQFKNPTINKDTTQSIANFENTFYTDDPDPIEKTENMLNEIWNNASSTPFTSIKELIQQPAQNKPVNADIIDKYKNEYKKVIGLSYNIEPEQGKTTQKGIIDKIEKATRILATNPEKDIVRFYGAMGCAIIYPLQNLNLPVFIIQAFHANKKSSFGSLNSLTIYMQIKVTDCPSYLPVVHVTDNPKAYKFRKGMCNSQHTIEVTRLLKKNELNIQLDNNKLFAGWTVPIPLFPPKYIIPPACIIFEGYGNVKTYLSELKGPLNRTVKFEFNSLDAFVTFMHPSSKYSGAGSDGLLHKEMIMISFPPPTLTTSGTHS